MDKSKFEGKFILSENKSLKQFAFTYETASLFRIGKIRDSENSTSYIVEIDTIVGPIPEEFILKVKANGMSSLYEISYKNLENILCIYDSILDVPQIKRLETQGENNG